ncbi:peptidoglycan DD-metalloendopeptidase family protein [Gordonia sp. SND2]|uniref:peptidoglycan DD-metalloendopeptidase family protein n=1 Tax=Gordonia sp. SND2 TaxID=3388659 RepID=UPI00398B3740
MTGRPENHSGVDLAAPDGTPFYACAGGTVLYIGPARGYGEWIVLDHPDSEGGGCSEYGHMWNSRATGLKVGDWVNAGQKIGFVGSNGESTGPHLHLTVWERAYGGKRIDPETWLDGAPHPPKGGGLAPQPPSAGMTAETLAAAMGCSLARAREMLPGMVGAMQAAQITTPLRAAHWCAQIGHESVGLVYMEEIASGDQYEWRTDLGNNQPGDGRRFKGSGPIQLTGRRNFGLFSEWCFAKRYTTSPTLFVDHPELVRTDPRWGFLAASWYWTVARPQLNRLADADDLYGVTRAINGGLNGLDDRRGRLDICKRLGAQLLPPQTSGGLTMEASDELTKRFPSRSIFRHSDDPVDTMAGFILNIDAREHEKYILDAALAGDAAAIKLVEREAAKGESRCIAALAKIKGDRK